MRTTVYLEVKVGVATDKPIALLAEIYSVCKRADSGFTAGIEAWEEDDHED